MHLKCLLCITYGPEKELLEWRSAEVRIVAVNAWLGTTRQSTQHSIEARPEI